MTSVVAWMPYCGPGSAPADWLTRWNLDPALLALLIGAVFLLVLRTRGAVRSRGLISVAVLGLAFVSPLCALSSALFAARTVHHVLLVAVAAPLIAWAFPEHRTKGLGFATAVQAVVFWAWHAPGAYAAALSNDAFYWSMQASVLGSAVWFWAAVRHARAPAAVIALLAAMVAMGLLGALITFAETPLYAPHLLTTQSWALTPLEDQQAAGLIMWAPASALYLAVALWVLGRWIGPDRRAPSAA